MTYDQFVTDFQIKMSQPFFNTLVIAFDAEYGEFTKANDIYEPALIFFILHNDKLGSKVTNATTRTVGGVSITISSSESTTETNYLDLLDSLLASKGWGSFGGFVAKGRGNGCV